jgi:hypothetical protein
MAIEIPLRMYCKAQGGRGVCTHVGWESEVTCSAHIPVHGFHGFRIRVIRGLWLAQSFRMIGSSAFGARPQYNSRVPRRIIFLILVLFSGINATAQVDRYDRKFFIQLRGVFGRFRDSDLERVFDRAQPIQCSELVNDEGEWRTVAFFNEKRELGDWYRRNFDEVKTDPAVFIFKGVCRGEHGPVGLTTKFPVTESTEAYSEHRIGFDEIVINVNPAVRAGLDPQTEAYTFELPYLFLVGEHDGGRLYSLEPPRLLDRYNYALNVVDSWACKSVSAENVTYQFLICRTTTLPRNRQERNSSRAAFGASAYFILSDGKEASSSVKLSFDSDDSKHTIEDTAAVSVPEVDNTGSSPGTVQWEIPDPEEKILDVVRDEFRIGFAPKTWTGRIGSAQVLSAKRISTLEAAKPADGADYCIWLPGTASSAVHMLSDDPIVYGVTAHNQDGQSSTSLDFIMKTPEGMHLGTLQCIFPRASSATAIDFQRWTSVVGDHLSLEVKP